VQKIRALGTIISAKGVILILDKHQRDSHYRIETVSA
jgi:hypothetical protein